MVAQHTSRAAPCYTAAMQPRRGSRRTLALALALGLALGAGCRRAAAPPRELRVVSLTPSATELVHALGMIDRLVGVDQYSTFPAQVAALPKVGTFLAPNLEAILALRPSHVVADDVHGDTATALRDAGITAVVLPMHSLADVRSSLTALGDALGRREAAAEIVRTIDAELERATAARPARAPRVLVALDHEAGSLAGLVAAASGTWIDQLLATVGASNALAASGVRYPKVSVEEVIAADPDVVLDLSFGDEPLAPWRTLGLRAATSGRVFSRNDPYLISPSPRVPEALRALREVLAAPAAAAAPAPAAAAVR
jgi:iron complex transport system substrate-binding protein